MANIINKYQWVKTEALDAYCISIITGTELIAIETAFGIERNTLTQAKSSEMGAIAGPDSEGNDVVQIGELENAVITFENNGWTGIDHRVIKHIAAPIYVSMYRNVNAVMRFVFAKNGEIIREFDAVLYDPELAIAEELALDFSGDDKDALSFALAEKLTGIPIDGAWLLEGRRPTYRRS
jgi:Family of unknown function (DUF6461)